MVALSLGTTVEVFNLKRARQLCYTIIRFARGEHVESTPTLIGSAVGSGNHSLQIVAACLLGGNLAGVRCTGHSGNLAVVHIQVDALYGLGYHLGVDVDADGLALGGLGGSWLDVYHSLHLHAGERTLGVLGGIGLHILAQPLQRRALLFVLNQTRYTLLAGAVVFYPGVTVEPSPDGYSGAVVGLPHHREVLLEVPLLVSVVLVTYVVLGYVHRHLQCILYLLHHRGKV